MLLTLVAANDPGDNNHATVYFREPVEDTDDLIADLRSHMVDYGIPHGEILMKHG
jgi:hypothetical protein